MIDSLSGDIFRPKNTNVFGAVIPTESILRTVEFTGGGIQLPLTTTVAIVLPDNHFATTFGVFTIDVGNLQSILAQGVNETSERNRLFTAKVWMDGLFTAEYSKTFQIFVHPQEIRRQMNLTSSNGLLYPNAPILFSGIMLARLKKEFEYFAVNPVNLDLR